MMNPNSQLLYWIWIRSRFAILAMLLIVLVTQIAYWLCSDIVSQTLIGWGIFLSIAVGFLSAIAVFSFGSNLDFTNGKSAYPAWLFSLPFTSWRLAFIPPTLMVIAMAWTWIPAALIFNAMGPAAQNSSLIWLFLVPWLTISGFGTWIQAISWRPFRVPVMRIVSLLVLLFLYVLGNVVGSVFELPVDYFVLGHAAFALLGFIMASRSVFIARQQGSQTGFSDTASATIIKSEDEGACYSPELRTRIWQSEHKALSWRDWKKLGIVPIVMTGMVMSLYCFMVLTTTVSVAIFLTLIIPILVSAFTSIKLGRASYWSGQSRMPYHLAGLPPATRSCCAPDSGLPSKWHADAALSQ